MQMPKENIDTIMFAPCGMNCKVCYKHCYHKKPCAGYLNNDKGKPEHCRKCKIKDCVKEKLLFVQEHGLEKFMEQQKDMYTCPKCGGIISIHDRECSECQEKM